MTINIKIQTLLKPMKSVNTHQRFYLNRVELDEQSECFLRNRVKIEVGLVGNGRLERGERGFDKGEVFELPESP